MADRYDSVTPAFFGAGMLSGINASWSFLGGSVLAWGVIAPSLVKNGLAFGVAASDEFPLVSYNSLSFSDPDKYTSAPSPRYWLLCKCVLRDAVEELCSLLSQGPVSS